MPDMAGGRYTQSDSHVGSTQRGGFRHHYCGQLLMRANGAVLSYRLRIEALLLKEEFNQMVDWLKPSIDAVVISARGSCTQWRK